MTRHRRTSDPPPPNAPPGAPAAAPAALPTGAPRPADELALLAAAAAGDPDAARRLIDATYRDVFRALARLAGGDADLAADLTQETYRKAWARIGDFRGGARFSTWLYRIAYTTFLDHARRPRPVEPLDDARSAALGDPATGPEDAALAAAEAERLRRAVLELPESLRFTVTARFWRGLSAGEIARLDGITAAAVRKRLGRALAMLSAQLDEEVDR